MLIHDQLLRAEMLAIRRRAAAFEEMARTARAMARMRAEILAERAHVAAIRRQLEEGRQWQSLASY